MPEAVDFHQELDSDTFGCRQVIAAGIAESPFVFSYERNRLVSMAFHPSSVIEVTYVAVVLRFFQNRIVPYSRSWLELFPQSSDSVFQEGSLYLERLLQQFSVSFGDDNVAVYNLFFLAYLAAYYRLIL